MELFDLLLGISYEVVHGKLKDIDIHEVCFDSRTVKPDDVFVCISGSKYNSHNDFDKVCDKGAKVIIVEENIETKRDVIVLKVKNTRKALSYLCINFFGRPHTKMCVIGITGSRGKTSTLFMLYELLKKAGRKCGIIGSFGVKFLEENIETENTTPGPFVIQGMLRRMLDRGVDTVIIEVSAYGLKQERVTGIDFDIAIYMNTFPEYMFENQFSDLNEYIRCKGELFKKCKLAIINGDDSYMEEILHNTSCDIIKYGLTSNVDFRADRVDILSDFDNMGLSYDIYDVKRTHIEVGQIGRLNVYNSLAAFAALDSLGYDINKYAKELKNIVISGRGEVIKNDKGICVVIDSTRTKLGLEAFFTAINEYRKERVISVISMNDDLNDYDFSKIADFTDFCIFTSDEFNDEKINCVKEDTLDIISNTMESFAIICDRKEAINCAIGEAKTNDIVVILGKGSSSSVNDNEYQIIESILQA